MRAFKTTLGAVLLLAGLTLAVVEIIALVDPTGSKMSDDGDPLGDPHILWLPHAATALIIGLCVCSSFLLLRRLPNIVAGIRCPSCGEEGDYTPAHSLKSSVNPLVFFFGGVLLSMFWSGSRLQRFQCCQCNELFQSQTAASKGYRVLFLLMLALVALSIYGEFANP